MEIDRTYFNTIDISGMSREQWLELRKGYIGGSDCSSVMGFNPYKSAYEVWGEKTGLYTPSKPINEKMFFGNYLEDKIRNLFQYWTEDFQQTAYNFDADFKVREVIKPDFMCVSKEYPFMAANLDGVVFDKAKGFGVLECKTMSGWMHDQYETGIPPYHFLQLQHCLAVTGYKWGILAVLVDGSDFQVYEFEREEKVIANIIKKETELWKYIADALPLVNTKDQHKIVEPPMDGSDATEEFLKEKYNNPLNEEIIEGTEEDLQTAVKMIEFKAKIAELEMQMKEKSNTLKRRMANAGILSFGDKGQLTWKANKNGVRSFKNSLKLN